MATKNRKQAEDLDREQRQAEDVSSGFQARREHRGRHDGGVCGQGGREFCGGSAAFTTPSRTVATTVATVVEEEDVDYHEPAAHGPDGVAGCGLRE